MKKEPVIEKGIPIPPRGAASGSSITVTVKRMEVGDSIVVDKHGNWSARVCSQRIGVKLCARRIDEKSWRMWRVA